VLAVLQAGDHLLMVDSVYEPTRAICHKLLAPLGIETTFYDPLVGGAIEALFRDNTRALFLESPGSLTFEVQDLPALTRVARARGIVTIIDNTWATPLRMRALELGADISVQSLTKYVGGHSDLMLGSATAVPAQWERLKNAAYRLGQCASPDDAALALRGLRTLAARLDRHEAAALEVARWLAGHPLVDRVLHPAFDSCPGHELWARDFTGSTGLFSILLKRGRRADTAALTDGLRHFGIGFSYGGYESLILPSDPRRLRTATRWDAPGPLIRLSIGLEDPDDLIADLAEGLARFEKATAAA
jgi:cystathionine beta-lyase